MLPETLVNILGPEKVEEDLRNIMALHSESHKLMQDVPKNLMPGAALDDEDSQKVLAFYMAVIATETATLKFTSSAINAVTGNRELQAHYQSYNLPLAEVIRAEMLQHFDRDKSIPELIEVVKDQQNTIKTITQSLERWEKERQN